MKILLTGGSGKLGREILKLDPKIIAPSHKKMNILGVESVAKVLLKSKLDVVIHAAALVGTKECEENKTLAWNTNVAGTRNITFLCQALRIRLVFISSAVVFDGKRGNYKPDDIPNPTFYYAMTKVVGEEIVKSLAGYLIIRLDFFPLDGFKYKKVFTDHYTSKIPVNEAAREVLKRAKSKMTGIVHVGQKRDSLYNILKPYYLDIEPIRIADSKLPEFPKDISLSLSRRQ